MPVLKAAAKALPAHERRATIIAAVVALAATRNPADITTTAIAEEVGLTQGALFKHFPTKDALLAAVLEWVSTSLAARLDTAEATATDALDALQRMFTAHVQFVVEHPGMPRIVFGELQQSTDAGSRHIVQAMQRRYGERLHRLLSTAQSEGRVAADLDVPAAVTLFIGSVQGLVVQSLVQGNFTHMARHADGVFAHYRRGLEASR